MILYARRFGSRLVKEGMLDWIDIPPILSSNKLHPTEKPVGLGRELIQRSGHPGDTLYDPFTGSGAFLEAAFHESLFSIGCEIGSEAYASLCYRIAGLVKQSENVNF